MRKVWVPLACLALVTPTLAFAQVGAMKDHMADVSTHLSAGQTPDANCAATPIACGQTITGSLASGDCQLNDGTFVDYYQFAGTNGESITATMTANAFTPAIQLLNPASQSVTGNNGPGTAQVKFTLNSTGNWTISANNAATTQQTGGYTMNLTCGSTNNTCPQNATTLCIGGGRFSVKATFDAGSGNSGNAQAVGLTSDTGYLWFFEASNVEAVVKVIDGCALNGHYWIFAGGLTNVNVVMTVTDLQTGAQRTYTNPANTTFEPIQDTSAFSTCP